MFNPPITGNDELDAYLSQLALEGDNATTGVTINNSTGQIIDIGSGIVIGYLYKYMHVKYADSNTGLNISDSPTNKGYFGLYNTNSSTESLNPADYTWYIATGGFGTTKFLFYVTNGGRQFQFQVNTASPSFQWVQDTGSAIDLDIVTSSFLNANPSIYIWTPNITPPARPSTQTTYTWSTGAYTAPAGWSTTIPENTTPGNYLWSLNVPLTVPSGTSSTLIPWNNVSYPIRSIGYNGTNGTIGGTGPRSTSGYVYYQLASDSQPGTPSGSGFNFIDNSFASLTTNWSSSFTIAASNAGKYWASRYSVSEATFGGTQTISFSAPFNWQNYNGLITFSNLEFGIENNVTFIDGGKITTNSLSVNSIAVGTTTTQSGNTFGFGNGTTIYGILTSGFFKSTRSDSAALAVTGINNVALAVGGASNSTALFSNTLGVDSINPAYVICGAMIGGTGGGFQQAAFLQRRGAQAGAAAEANPDAQTQAYGRIAYLQNGTPDTYGAKFMTSSGSTDVRGIVVGGPTNGLYVLGAGVSTVGFTPFTGMHVCLKPNTVALQPGDICVDTSIYLKPNVNDTLSFVDVSDSPEMKGAIGVYTNMSEATTPNYMEIKVKKPYLEHGVIQHEVITELDPQYETLLEENTLVLVNGVGEGLINVCGENGNIQSGDLIVTSSIPGKGMKQNDNIVRSITVARSREDVTFSSLAEVKQIACIYLAG
jgi:hypothetical protein